LGNPERAECPGPMEGDVWRARIKTVDVVSRWVEMEPLGLVERHPSSEMGKEALELMTGGDVGWSTW